MKKVILVMLSALALLSGCASVPMQDTKLLAAPKENMALVTFVRPAVFLGDGMGMNVWHGQDYVGSIAAGSMIQLEVTPGKHLFMASAENWSYASADLQAGKSYMIKVNLFPGVVRGRVALGTVKLDDSRRPVLMALKPTIASETDRKDVTAKASEKTRAAIANFESGKVTSYARVTPADGL